MRPGSRPAVRASDPKHLAELPPRRRRGATERWAVTGVVLAWAAYLAIPPRTVALGPGALDDLFTRQAIMGLAAIASFLLNAGLVHVGIRRPLSWRTLLFLVPMTLIAFAIWGVIQYGEALTLAILGQLGALNSVNAHGALVVGILLAMEGLLLGILAWLSHLSLFWTPQRRLWIVVHAVGLTGLCLVPVITGFAPAALVPTSLVAQPFYPVVTSIPVGLEPEKPDLRRGLRFCAALAGLYLLGVGLRLGSGSPMTEIILWPAEIRIPGII